MWNASTISIDDKLASDFAQWIADRGDANRSKAVRDLLRRELDHQRIVRSPKGHCVAALSYVFNHHELLAERITGLQHPGAWRGAATCAEWGRAPGGPAFGPATGRAHS